MWPTAQHMCRPCVSARRPDETTLAVLKGILGVMGTPEGTGWDSMRGHVTSEMLAKLVTMSPQVGQGIDVGQHSADADAESKTSKRGRRLHCV